MAAAPEEAFLLPTVSLKPFDVANLCTLMDGLDEIAGLADGMPTKSTVRQTVLAALNVFTNMDDDNRSDFIRLTELQKNLKAFLATEEAKPTIYPIISEVARTTDRNANAILLKLIALQDILAIQIAERYSCGCGLRIMRKSAQVSAGTGLVGAGGYTGYRLVTGFANIATNASDGAMEVIPGLLTLISAVLYCRQVLRVLQLQENLARDQGKPSPNRGRLGCAAIIITALQTLSAALLVTAGYLFFFGNQHNLLFSALSAGGLSSSVAVAPLFVAICHLLCNYQRPVLPATMAALPLQPMPASAAATDSPAPAKASGTDVDAAGGRPRTVSTTGTMPSADGATAATAPSASGTTPAAPQ